MNEQKNKSRDERNDLDGHQMGYGVWGVWGIWGIWGI